MTAELTRPAGESSPPIRLARAARVATGAVPTWAWVMLGYLLLAVVATWPLALDLTGHIYGHAGGDGIGGIAFFNSWKQSILQGHPGRDPLLLYPFGVNLRTALVPPLYFAVELPLTFLLGGAGAYNLLAFLCFPLSAIAAYGLCRVLGISPPAAAAAGVFNGFTAYHAAHAAGHTTLPHTEFFALVLAALLLWRERGGWWRALLAGLALAATLTWDYYFAIFAMLMVGAAGPAWLVADIARRGWWQGIWRGLQLVGVGVVGVAVAIPLFALARADVPAGALSTRSAAEILSYSAQPCQLLLPWPGHPELAWLGCPAGAIPQAEVALDIGLVALALAGFFIAGSAVRGLPGRVSAQIWVVLPIALVGLAWAVPAVWQEFLHTSPPDILWRYVAGLRVNSRAVILVQLAVAVLAGAGLERIIGARLARRQTPASARPARLAWAVCGAAAAVFFFESVGIASAANPLPRPAVNDWLATQPRGTVIIQYPAAFPGTPSEGTGYFYSYYHDRYLLPEIGTQLGAPNEGSDMATELWAGGPQTAGDLAAMGVRYAVSHSGENYDLGRRRDPLVGLPGFRPVFSSGGDTVYQVTASPTPFAYVTGDFRPLEGASLANYARWMVTHGRIAIENPLGHSVPAVLHLDLWCLRDKRSRVLVRGDGADQHLSDVLGPEDIRLTLPPGRSYVELIPPNPPQPIAGADSPPVTLYVFRPHVTT